MSWKFLSGRRVWLMLLSTAIGGALFSWRRRSTRTDQSGPPEWPPLPDPQQPTATPGSDTPVAAASDEEAATEGSDTPVAADAPAGADVSESASETGAAAVAADAAWVAADAAGSCPTTHPIKAKESSGIFHVPGGRFYDRTNADRCYVSGDAAESDGYRQSKS